MNKVKHKHDFIYEIEKVLHNISIKYKNTIKVELYTEQKSNNTELVFSITKNIDNVTYRLYTAICYIPKDTNEMDIDKIINQFINYRVKLDFINAAISFFDTILTEQIKIGNIPH